MSLLAAGPDMPAGVLAAGALRPGALRPLSPLATPNYLQKRIVKFTPKMLIHSNRDVFNFWGPSPAFGPQDGIGQGRLRPKRAKGRFRPKIDGKVRVVRMGLPIE